MAVGFQVTFDAADPRALGRFWAEALGYEEDQPPEGFADWEEWLRKSGIPEESWNDAYALSDPDGAGPRGSSSRRSPSRRPPRTGSTSTSTWVAV